MNLTRFISLYLTSLLSFLLIDAVWLGVIAKNLYQNQIGHLLKVNINWLAAIIFYLLFIVGIVVFAIIPGLEKKSLLHTLILAALFGAIAYATYDLTNLATLKNWPLSVTIIDIIWGATISALVAAITFILRTRSII